MYVHVHVHVLCAYVQLMSIDTVNISHLYYACAYVVYYYVSSILQSQAVWFGCDVDKHSDAKMGLLDLNM